jgi:murein DD-endopeptidase MepM/ murein hydrolase activator NlpD
MINRKFEERLSKLENQMDDIWFWTFIICILVGFGFIKFGNVTPQIFNQSSEQIKQFQPSKDAPKFRKPLQGAMRQSSGFGMRIHPITGESKMHTGIDLNPILEDQNKSTVGQPIFAVADGVVESVGDLGGCGLGVRIQHSGGYLSVYCHSSEILIKQGQSVKAGDKIALIGSTGMSTGPHLHFGMKLNGEWIDPKKVVPMD